LSHLTDSAYTSIGARNLFLRLTSPGEGVSDTRRRLDCRELQWENTDTAKIEHVSGQLSAALVSWSRVLAERFRDPRVGSDVLFGAVGGVATQLLWQVTMQAPSWCGWGSPYVFGFERTAFAAPQQTLLGGRYCLGEFLQRQTCALAIGLSILLLLLLLRLLLRRQWLAGAAYVLIGAVLWPVGVGDPAFSRITAGLTSTELSAWHATGTTLFPLAVIVALASYRFHTARAGRPLFRDWVVS
jgi:hypothetical protein